MGFHSRQDQDYLQYIPNFRRLKTNRTGGFTLIYCRCYCNIIEPSSIFCEGKSQNH